MGQNTSNQNLLLGAVLGIVLVAGVPEGVLAQSSSVVVAQSAELEEAERLMERVAELEEQGKYGEATPLAEKALAIREKELGPDHPDVAESLNSLAELYLNQGNLVEAEPLLQRSLAIREKVLRPDHPDAAESLSNLATLYYFQGNYAEAEPLYMRSLAIKEKALGPDHPDVAIGLNNLALLYSDQGNYAEAEPLLQRSLAIVEKALGADHPDVATSLNNLAALYDTQGKYAEAEPLLQRALAIVEKALGPDHPDVATGLSNLAALYKTQGKYAEAEPLYMRSLAIKEKALGPNHPDVAIGLNNLALLYDSQGNYAEAEPLLQRSLAIVEKALGPDRPSVALALNNLAGLYYFQGNYAEAEPLYIRSLAIREKALGPDHPDVAVSLNGLGNLYYFQGNYAEAETQFQRALAISEKALGPDHPDVALALNNLAELYRHQGNYAEAEPLYQQSLAIFEKALGADHPDVAASLSNLAAFYDATDDIPRAIQFATRALNVEETNIALNLAIGSERRKRDYMETLSGRTNIYISLHLNSAPDNLQAARLALTAILQRKGRILDAVSSNLQILRDNLTPENQALLKQLAATRNRIATAVFAKEPPPGIDIPALQQKAERLETQLAAASAEYRVESQPTTIEAVQQLIPDDAALVELIYYYPFDSKTAKPEDRFSSPHYAAYILHSVGEPQWIDLGEAAPIDELAEEFRKAIRQEPLAPGQRPRLTGGIQHFTLDQIKEKARALDQLVMQPVRPLLKNKTHILLSPDSQLNLIPFASLVDRQNRFLVEIYNITYLSSGRDLLKLQLPTPRLQPSLILGNIDFDSAAGPSTDSIFRGGDTRSTDLSLVGFNPLPGTKAEIDAITPLLPNATVLEGGEATEAAVAQAKKPRVLHLATHGFFFPDAKTEPTQLEEPAPAVGENPLLRSGLALAGFNSRDKTSSSLDGVLTALEVTALNLRGTQLVVLSACSTGLGDVANGDGVYGLRRAFTIAGVESQLMSLWKVSDFHTQEMMVGYYQQLKDGMGRSDAMRDIQLEMLKEYEYPFYWASFIPAGSWEPMEVGTN
jgi:CHAT domain-containing protein/Flp pilus assembly protein TadD